MAEAVSEQPSMALVHNFPEIGDLTHFPEQPDGTGMDGELSDLLIAGEHLQ